MSATETFDDLRHRFRAARENKGWTQADLADRLEVHWVTISKLERGNMRITPEWADRLSLALGLALDVSVDTDEVGERPCNVEPVVPMLGSELRSARVARNMKQHEVAAALDVTVQAVSQWERDETSPTGINLLKLSSLFGQSLLMQQTAAYPDSSNLKGIIEEIEKAYDFLAAIEKAGAGIGGDAGQGVSAVAVAAKGALNKALSAARALDGGDA